MAPFRTLTGEAVSLPQANVDTDIIFPARFLLVTEKKGLGKYAFHDKHDDPAFAFQPGAPILVTGDNFGCGSSREQAPWALADLGIRAIVGPSFGEIFLSNCFKNGLLAITLPSDHVDSLHAAARAGEPFAIDLEAQEIRLPQTGTFAFRVEPARREALLEGLDEIAKIRTRHAASIERFETAQRARAPWLWTRESAVNG